MGAVHSSHPPTINIHTHTHTHTQVPLEKLKERREWRERRLAALVGHTAQMKAQENLS